MDFLFRYRIVYSRNRAPLSDRLRFGAESGEDPSVADSETCQSRKAERMWPLEPKQTVLFPPIDSIHHRHHSRFRISSLAVVEVNSPGRMASSSPFLPCSIRDGLFCLPCRLG
ncbi:hypothetical protein CEXT_373081 [Caerostris extrusa]|uniref:Uncharacterized protein n=1 Tax=Caerostris extrusa TaxID=172846 RepID=A0AAV4UBR1_CAEEX|nr:hypothetical protein CEXT_373081 [Caerostris extrusa]